MKFYRKFIYKALSLLFAKINSGSAYLFNAVNSPFKGHTS